MATAYTFPTDQNRLAAILRLGRNQYSDSSLLNELMVDQMRWDTDEGTDTVALVLADMTEYETLSAAYLTSQGQQGKSSVSIAGEYSVSYTNTVQSTYSGQLGELKARIRKFLDPENNLGNLRGARPRVT